MVKPRRPQDAQLRLDQLGACGLGADVETELHQLIFEPGDPIAPPLIVPELAIKVSDFLGRVMAHSEDGGYLFGLAVGQLIHVPALVKDGAQ